MKLDATANVVSWCADECSRQKTDPKLVANMFNAWRWVYEFEADPRTIDARHLEHFIMAINAKVLGDIGASYRTTAVYFDDYRFAPAWTAVPQAMHSLCTHHQDVETSDFVYEFLKIHPFIDGNGRTAAILWNWSNNSLANPMTLPKFDFT